jgi:hypothetical protein
MFLLHACRIFRQIVISKPLFTSATVMARFFLAHSWAIKTLYGVGASDKGGLLGGMKRL